MRFVVNSPDEKVDIHKPIRELLQYATTCTPLNECNAEDCISKRQALKAICNTCSIHQNGGKCSKCEQYNALIDLLSVYSKNNRENKHEASN